MDSDDLELEMLPEPTSLAEWTMADFAEADGGRPASYEFIDAPNTRGAACRLIGGHRPARPSTRVPRPWPRVAPSRTGSRAAAPRLPIGLRRAVPRAARLRALQQ